MVPQRLHRSDVVYKLKHSTNMPNHRSFELKCLATYSPHACRAVLEPKIPHGTLVSQARLLPDVSTYKILMERGSTCIYSGLWLERLMTLLE